MVPKRQSSTETSAAVGAAVLTFREQRHWTQPGLAQRCADHGYLGFTKRVIRDIESERPDGTRRPITVDELVALAKAFGVHYTALMPAAPDTAPLDHEGLWQVLQDAIDNYTALQGVIDEARKEADDVR